MTDKVQKIREVVENRYEYWRKKEFNSHSIESEIRMSECQHLLLMLNSLQEEPVSEELEEAAEEWDGSLYRSDAFKAGAKWQKEQMMKDAIDTEASYTMSVPCITISLPLGVNVGDKVKVIIIKQK